MLRKIFIIALLSIAMKMNGQMTGSFRYADSVTYRLYTEKKWADLIHEGNNAVRNGYDYYYMRMRIGIAYYEKHNYAASALQFRKALSFNENDQIALEYLFYSYYFSGQTNRAFTLMSSFYPANRERIMTESKFKKNTLTAETFYSDAGTDKIISDPDSWFPDTEPGTQIATKYFINNEIYASHITGKNTSYFHSFTNLVKDNYLYYFDGVNKAHLMPQRIVQNQYYGSFSFFSSTGWVFSPAIHLLTTSYPVIKISTTGMNSSARAYNVRSNSFYTGASIFKSSGFFSVGIESGYASINSLKQVQGTVSTMFYPAGNSRIYFGVLVSAEKELKTLSSGIRIIEGFTAGFSIAGKVWFDLSGLRGDMKNYIGNNGLYIYNSTDLLKSKFSGKITIPFPKAGLTIFAGGGVSSYSSYYIPLDGIITDSANELNYSSNNFTGGISWNF